VTGGGGSLYNPPLQVVEVRGTRRGDADRGPVVYVNGDEAALRLLVDGELVRVQGPRRAELAVLRVEERVPRGHVVVRDVAGLVVTEIVRLSKLDTDRPPRRNLA
jgi:anaerobic selenocysteine-containing dehydrogenase